MDTRWVVQRVSTGKYFRANPGNSRDPWGDFEGAMHFDHPYHAWDLVRALGYPPKDIKVIEIAVMYKTRP